MSGRLAILVGFIAGLATAGIAIALAIVYAPQIADALYPTPAVPGVTAPPTLPPMPSSGGASPSAGSSPAGSSAPPVSATPDPSRSPSASGSGAFRVGEAAPSLVLPLLGGGTVDIAQLRGQALWVNFMATWCEPCRDEFPQMSVFQARYEEEGLIVLAVDVREDADVVAAFAEATGAIFRIALDEDGRAQRTWGIAALPIHFWIDREGIIRDGALGGIGPDAMARGIAAILPEVAITPP